MPISFGLNILVDDFQILKTKNFCEFHTNLKIVPLFIKH